MFAVVAAVAIFLNVSYGRESTLEQASKLVAGTAGGAATLLAAWYWLESETIGGPGGYIYPLGGMLLLLVLMMVISAGLGMFRDWRRHRQSRDHQ